MMLPRKRYVFYGVLVAALCVLTLLFYEVTKQKPLMAKQKATKPRDLSNITERGILEERAVVLASSSRHLNDTSDTEKNNRDDRRKVGSINSERRTEKFEEIAPLTSTLNSSINRFSTFYENKYSLQKTERPLGMLGSQIDYKTIISTKTSIKLSREGTSFHETLAQSRPDLVRSHGQTKKLAVVIVALMRSGSSFVSELFNNHFDFFYLFEPFWTLQRSHKYFFREKGPDILYEGKGIPVKRTLDNSVYQRARLQMLTGVLHCNFTRIGEFFSSYFKDRFVGRRASRTVWDACRNARFRERTENGIDCPILIRDIPRVLTDLCSRHKHVAVKIIRVFNIGELMPLVEDPSLDLKILHLIRDPRGIVASRLTLSHPAALWNQTGLQDRLIPTQSVDDICGWMERNVQHSETLPQPLQGRYALVRYEDVAADPSTMAEKMYKFLGIPIPAEVTAWVDKNTKGHHLVNNPYQTNRNSRAMLNTWRPKLALASVLKVQNRCNNIMAKLGYRRVQNLEELTNLKNVLIEEPLPEIANLIT